MYVLKNTDAVPSTTFPVRNCFMSKEMRYLKTESHAYKSFLTKNAYPLFGAAPYVSI